MINELITRFERDHIHDFNFYVESFSLNKKLFKELKKRKCHVSFNKGLCEKSNKNL